MYKKSRTKRLPPKKYHKKHHPNSTETPPFLPWNVYEKEIRKKLNTEQNKFISTDSLYCCWEEEWTLQETIDECIEAFANSCDLRC